MLHIRFTEYPLSRWKNGQGTTREIAVAPETGATPETGVAPAWRISMATISVEAAFSTFPGLDRSLAVVEGAGIELTVNGLSRLLAVGDEPARFSGDSPASARPINGTTLDLNLMLDPLRANGDVSAVRAGEHKLSDGHWFVVVLADRVGLGVKGHEVLVMGRLDTATFVVAAGEYRLLTLIAQQEAPTEQPVAYLVRVRTQPANSSANTAGASLSGP